MFACQWMILYYAIVHAIHDEVAERDCGTPSGRGKPKMFTKLAGPVPPVFSAPSSMEVTDASESDDSPVKRIV